MTPLIAAGTVAGAKNAHAAFSLSEDAYRVDDDAPTPNKCVVVSRSVSMRFPALDRCLGELRDGISTSAG